MATNMTCKCGRKYSSLTVNCLHCNDQTPWASDYARLCSAEPSIGMECHYPTFDHVCVQLVEGKYAIGFAEYEHGEPTRVGHMPGNTVEQVLSLCGAFLSSRSGAST